MKHTEKLAYDDKSLSLFIEDIKKYSPLSDEEVKEFSLKANEGCEYSRNKLVKHNLRFVISAAKKYRNQGVPYSDLIVAGITGLINCAEKYVYNEETKFLSYAVKGIQREILKEIALMSRCVKIPHRALPKIMDLNKRVAAGEVLRGDEALFYMALQSSVSLDAPTKNDDGDETNDYLIDQISNETNEGEAYMEHSDLSQLIKDEISNIMNDQEAVVITMYFGLEDGEPLTLEKIGEKIGVSRARAGFVYQKALSKLKVSNPIFEYYVDNGSTL